MNICNMQKQQIYSITFLILVALSCLVDLAKGCFLFFFFFYHQSYMEYMKAAQILSLYIYIIIFIYMKWKPKTWSVYNRQERGSFLRQAGRRNQISNGFIHAFQFTVITNMSIMQLSEAICQQLLPGLVVIMVFDITVAVIQFLNLSKFILTSAANITGHKIKNLLPQNMHHIKNYSKNIKTKTLYLFFVGSNFVQAGQTHYPN